MNNAIKYPEAWKIFVECARKWPDDNPSEGDWIYGIPDPQNKSGYLYSDCPGKLFLKFKTNFYKTTEEKIKEFRDFLVWLEFQEGKR
jgi:hypothetical protein